MNKITVLASVIASGSLLLAVMYGCVWLLDRKARAALAFAFEALSHHVESGLHDAEWARGEYNTLVIET